MKLVFEVRYSLPQALIVLQHSPQNGENRRDNGHDYVQAFRIERCDLIPVQVSEVKIEVLHGYRRQFGPLGSGPAVAGWQILAFRRIQEGLPGVSFASPKVEK